MTKQKNRKSFILTVVAMCVAGCTGSNQRGSQRPFQFNRPGGADVVVSRKAETPKILPETHFASARLFESRRMLHKAIKQYEKAIALNHHYVEAYQRVGLLLSYTGQRKRAVVALRRAVELRPDDAILRNNLGFELLMAKHLQEASDQLTQAVALDGDFARARVNLGMANSLLGRFDDALADFLAVLPEADAYYNLGLMHRSGKRPELAAQAFRRVLTIRPDFSAAQRQLESVVVLLERATPATEIEQPIDRPKGERLATVSKDFAAPARSADSKVSVDGSVETSETSTVAVRSSIDIASWNKLVDTVNQLAVTTSERTDRIDIVDRPIARIDSEVTATTGGNDPAITDAVTTWASGTEAGKPLNINKLVAIIEGEQPCDEEVEIAPTSSTRVDQRRSPSAAPRAVETVVRADVRIVPAVAATKVFTVNEAKRALEPDPPIREAAKSDDIVKTVESAGTDRSADIVVAPETQVAARVEPTVVDRADCLADVDMGEILSSPADVVVEADDGVSLESIMSPWVEPEIVGEVSIDLALIASVHGAYDSDAFDEMFLEEEPCENYLLIDYRQDFARIRPTPTAMVVAPLAVRAKAHRTSAIETAVTTHAVIETFSEDLWWNYVDTVSSSADPIVTFSVVVPAPLVEVVPVITQPREPVASTDAISLLRELEFALAEVRNDIVCFDALDSPGAPTVAVLARVDRDEQPAGAVDLGPVWSVVDDEDGEVGPPIALAAVLATSDSPKKISARKLDGTVRLVAETGSVETDEAVARLIRSRRSLRIPAAPKGRTARSAIKMTPSRNRSRVARGKQRGDARSGAPGFMEVLRNELDCLQLEEEALEASTLAAVVAIDARQPFEWPVFDIDRALNSRLGDRRFDHPLTLPEPTDRPGWDWSGVREDAPERASTRPVSTPSDLKTKSESFDWLFSAYGHPRKP